MQVRVQVRDSRCEILDWIDRCNLAVLTSATKDCDDNSYNGEAKVGPEESE